MTIQEKARQAAVRAVKDYVWRGDVPVTVLPEAADAVAVLALWEARDRLATSTYTGPGSGVGVVDCLLAEFSPSPRPEPAAPETPEPPPQETTGGSSITGRWHEFPVMYSKCRICGRGAQTESMHALIAMHGVHTDANGVKGQWNKGTAYCDHCEDETLVIQPVASESRPTTAPAPSDVLERPEVKAKRDIVRQAILAHLVAAPTLGFTSVPLAIETHIDALLTLVLNLAPPVQAPEGRTLKEAIAQWSDADSMGLSEERQQSLLSALLAVSHG